MTSKDTNSLAKLMGGKYSDLKLVSQGVEFKVHKAIVCTQSSVIEAACDGGFEEATTNTIVAKEFDPETVKLMVEFMYTKDYTVEDEDVFASEKGSDHVVLSEAPLDKLSIADSQDGSPGDKPHGPAAGLRAADSIMLRHVRVNAIADYYDISALKKLANLKIQHAIDAAWSADSFPDVINEVFHRNGDLKLRQMMASVAAAHIEELAEQDAFSELDVMSDLGIEIIRNMISAQKLLNEELQAARSQLQQADIRLQVIEQEKASEVARSVGLQSAIDRMHRDVGSSLETLANTTACRNLSCQAQFNCYIERTGFAEDLKFILRCSRCKCKHTC